MYHGRRLRLPFQSRIIPELSISGFRNRLLVGLNWAVSYFTYKKSNRLIISNIVTKNNIKIILLDKGRGQTTDNRGEIG